MDPEIFKDVPDYELDAEKKKEIIKFHKELKSIVKPDGKYKKTLNKGKYLHQSDFDWVKDNTKFKPEEILKWFKCFR